MEAIIAGAIIVGLAIIGAIVQYGVTIRRRKRTIQCKNCGEKFPDEPPYFVSDLGHFCCSEKCLAKTNHNRGRS